MELQGKKAWIIGASRGIGKAIALAYAREGAQVVLSGRKAETLEAVAEEIRAQGGVAHTLVWDIREVARAEERTAQAAVLMGGLDTVVNNAGVIDRVPFLKVDEATWDAVMDTNLKGVYFACQAQINHMIANGVQGKIINISSETGNQPAPLPYSISKWGVTGLTMGLARKVYKLGITVSAIAPGPITTEMMNWQEGKDDSFPNAFGTMARPEDVAETAVFLASPRAVRVAGRPVFVSGGLDW